jgi:hypothetical protein
MSPEDYLKHEVAIKQALKEGRIKWSQGKSPIGRANGVTLSLVSVIYQT